MISVSERQSRTHESVWRSTVKAIWTLGTLAILCGAAASANATDYTFQQINSAAINGIAGGFVQALGFNDFGQIVGNTTAGETYDGAGFVYNLNNGQTTFTLNVRPTSINDLGVYFGAYEGPDPQAASASANNSYLDAYVSTYRALRVPGPLSSLSPGYIPGYGTINDLGFVAGSTFTRRNYDGAGFVYNLNNETTLTLNPTSINDLGVYFGAYEGPDPQAASASANNSWPTSPRWSATRLAHCSPDT